MAEYRAFFVNQQKHIERQEDFQATDDEAALTLARQFVDGDGIVEVWSDGIFVGIVRTREPPKMPWRFR